MGYPEITDVIAEKKFRNLRQTYKNIKDQKNKSGSGNIQWVRFEEFDDLFRRDVVHNPEGIIELGVQETRIPKREDGRPRGRLNASRQKKGRNTDRHGRETDGCDKADADVDGTNI